MVSKAGGNGRVSRTTATASKSATASAPETASTARPSSAGSTGTRPTNSPRSGRPQSVSTEVMLAQARRMVSEDGVAEFSVRELAKALGLGFSDPFGVWAGR